MANWTADQMTSQNGKTVLITGANSGIGFFTALEMARAGATTILACRNLRKGDEAASKIRLAVPKARVEVALLDLGDLESIREFADDFNRSGRSLDILVNNAGIMTPQTRMTTKDGFEVQWGTNFLGHFALTGLLLPVLERTGRARIVTVSSIAYRGSKIQFHDLNAEKSYDPMVCYGQSKLADTVFGLELERRLRMTKSSVISIEAHPGVSRTEPLPNSHRVSRTFKSWFMMIATRVGMPAAQGALPSLYAASSPHAEGGKLYGPHALSGLRGYPVEEKFGRAVTEDPSLGNELWRIAQQQTGVHYL